MTTREGTKRKIRERRSHRQNRKKSQHSTLWAVRRLKRSHVRPSFFFSRQLRQRALTLSSCAIQPDPRAETRLIQDQALGLTSINLRGIDACPGLFLPGTIDVRRHACKLIYSMRSRDMDIFFVIVPATSSSRGRRWQYACCTVCFFS
jgi:hypothetical protein